MSWRTYRRKAESTVLLGYRWTETMEFEDDMSWRKRKNMSSQGDMYAHVHRREEI